MTIIVEFGSKTRGDSDSFSDKDVLIVPGKKNRLPNPHYFHVYTKNRLQKIKAAESLFLVHLRNEGIIISDDNGWMINFLDSVPNFKSPASEINTAQTYLTILLSILPIKKQKTWWLDCTYVFLRDFLIKRNSLRGRYSFSPREFGNTENTGLSSDLTEIIMQLRIGKSIHRSLNIVQPINSINEIKASIIDALNLDIVTTIPLAIAYDKYKKSNQYFELRLIEALILSGQVKPRDNSILKLIRNPQLYSWEIKRTKLSEKVLWVSEQCNQLDSVDLVLKNC